MASASPMPRLRRPSPGEFRGFVRRRRPVVIEGALDDWRALSTWTLERLGALTGNPTVRVRVRNAPPRTGFGYEEVPLGRLFRELESGTATDYLASYALLDRVPALWADISVPPYAGRILTSPRAFVGPGGSVSPLHYDIPHSLSAQISGRKKAVVMEFRRRDVLRDPELRAPACLVDAFDPDRSETWNGRAPRACWETVLEPGDLLYLPSRRHHFLRCIDTAVSLSFFWNTPVSWAMRHVAGLFAPPKLA